MYSLPFGSTLHSVQPSPSGRSDAYAFLTEFASAPNVRTPHPHSHPPLRTNGITTHRHQTIKFQSVILSAHCWHICARKHTHTIERVRAYRPNRTVSECVFVYSTQCTRSQAQIPVRTHYGIASLGSAASHSPRKAAPMLLLPLLLHNNGSTIHPQRHCLALDARE